MIPQSFCLFFWWPSVQLKMDQIWHNNKMKKDRRSKSIPKSHKIFTGQTLLRYQVWVCLNLFDHLRNYKICRIYFFSWDFNFRLGDFDPKISSQSLVYTNVNFDCTWSKTWKAIYHEKPFLSGAIWGLCTFHDVAYCEAFYFYSPSQYVFIAVFCARIAGGISGWIMQICLKDCFEIHAPTNICFRRITRE